MKTALAAILAATILSLAGVTPAPAAAPMLEPVSWHGSASMEPTPIAAAAAPLTPTVTALEATSAPVPLPPAEPKYSADGFLLLSDAWWAQAYAEQAAYLESLETSAALHPESEGWTFNGVFVDGVFIPADQCRPEDIAAVEGVTP